jgi:hypothetical protein
MFHDIIIKGPFGEVRMDGCSDQEIKEWVKFGLSKGATAFETFPTEAQ